MTHTSTPWKTGHLGAGHLWIGPDENQKPTAIVPWDFYGARDEARANADFIVKVVNAHDDLVAALERTLSWLTSYPGHAAMSADGPYMQARAALAKAEGK